MKQVLNTIRDAFEQRGTARYGNEDVTQLQHALQSAQLAINSGAEDRLIAAALLHDVGHILETDVLPAGCEENLDDDHESIGYQFVNEHFGPAVADPVRLHVAAKRYLCTVEPAYLNKLSPTSYKSFLDQGGTMSAEEKAAFEAEPYYREALLLRRWDDAAKDPQAETPKLDRVYAHLEACLIG